MGTLGFLAIWFAIALVTGLLLNWYFKRTTSTPFSVEERKEWKAKVDEALGVK